VGIWRVNTRFLRFQDALCLLFSENGRRFPGFSGHITGFWPANGHNRPQKWRGFLTPKPCCKIFSIVRRSSQTFHRPATPATPVTIPEISKMGALFSPQNQTLGGKSGELRPKMSAEHRCIPTRFQGVNVGIWRETVRYLCFQDAVFRDSRPCFCKYPPNSSFGPHRILKYSAVPLAKRSAARMCKKIGGETRLQTAGICIKMLFRLDYGVFLRQCFRVMFLATMCGDGIIANNKPVLTFLHWGVYNAWQLHLCHSQRGSDFCKRSHVSKLA